MSASFAFAQEKYPSPAITTVSPNSGELGKTVELTISGENFLEGAYVPFSPYMGITITSTQFLSPMEIRVTITVASDAPIGPRDVTIVNPDGQNCTLNGGLTLVEAEPIIDVTPPPAITGLTATNAHDGKVNLTWTPSAAEDFAYYAIYVSEGEIVDVTGLTPNAKIESIAAHTYQVTGLADGSVYYFAVTAVDVAGNEYKATTSVNATPTKVGELLSGAYSINAEAKTITFSVSWTGDCTKSVYVTVKGFDYPMAYSGIGQTWTVTKSFDELDLKSGEAFEYSFRADTVAGAGGVGEVPEEQNVWWLIGIVAALALLALIGAAFVLKHIKKPQPTPPSPPERPTAPTEPPQPRPTVPKPAPAGEVEVPTTEQRTCECVLFYKWKGGPAIKVVRGLDYYPKDKDLSEMMPGSRIGFSILAENEDILVQDCVTEYGTTTKKIGTYPTRIRYDWRCLEYFVKYTSEDGSVRVSKEKIDTRSTNEPNFKGLENSALYTLPLLSKVPSKGTLEVHVGCFIESGRDPTLQASLVLEISRTECSPFLRIRVTDIKQPQQTPDQAVEERYSHYCVPLPPKLDKGAAKTVNIQTYPEKCFYGVVLYYAAYEDKDRVILECKSDVCTSPPKEEVPLDDPISFEWSGTNNELGSDGPCVVTRWGATSCKAMDRIVKEAPESINIRPMPVDEYPWERLLGDVKQANGSYRYIMNYVHCQRSWMDLCRGLLQEVLPKYEGIREKLLYAANSAELVAQQAKMVLCLSGKVEEETFKGHMLDGAGAGLHVILDGLILGTVHIPPLAVGVILEYAMLKVLEAKLGAGKTFDEEWVRLLDLQKDFEDRLRSLDSALYAGSLIVSGSRGEAYRTASMTQDVDDMDFILNEMIPKWTKGCEEMKPWIEEQRKIANSERKNTERVKEWLKEYDEWCEENMKIVKKIDGAYRVERWDSPKYAAMFADIAALLQWEGQVAAVRCRLLKRVLEESCCTEIKWSEDAEHPSTELIRGEGLKEYRKLIK
jgi:hypothetical protein